MVSELRSEFKSESVRSSLIAQIGIAKLAILCGWRAADHPTPGVPTTNPCNSGSPYRPETQTKMSASSMSSSSGPSGSRRRSRSPHVFGRGRHDYGILGREKAEPEPEPEPVSDDDLQKFESDRMHRCDWESCSCEQRRWVSCPLVQPRSYDMPEDMLLGLMD